MKNFFTLILFALLTITPSVNTMQRDKKFFYIFTSEYPDGIRCVRTSSIRGMHPFTTRGYRRFDENQQDESNDLMSTYGEHLRRMPPPTDPRRKRRPFFFETVHVDRYGYAMSKAAKSGSAMVMDDYKAIFRAAHIDWNFARSLACNQQLESINKLPHLRKYLAERGVNTLFAMCVITALHLELMAHVSYPFAPNIPRGRLQVIMELIEMAKLCNRFIAPQCVGPWKYDSNCRCLLYVWAKRRKSFPVVWFFQKEFKQEIASIENRFQYYFPIEAKEFNKAEREFLEGLENPIANTPAIGDDYPFGEEEEIVELDEEGVVEFARDESPQLEEFEEEEEEEAENFDSDEVHRPDIRFWKPEEKEYNTIIAYLAITSLSF